MKIRNRVLLATILCFQLTACISNSTGTARPEANKVDAAELNYQLGARYFAAESYEVARDRLELAIDLDPKLGLAYSALALTHEKLNSVRLATETYELGVRTVPNDFVLQNAYALYLCRHDEPEQARRHFDRAIKHPENDSAEVTMTNAGVCMAQSGNTVAAEAYYRAAIERRPEYGEALLKICLMKYSQEDYLSSRAFLQRYMSTNVSTASVLYLASRIEDLLGNDRGRTDFEDQLIREYPTSPEARKVLGSS